MDSGQDEVPNPTSHVTPIFSNECDTSNTTIPMQVSQIVPSMNIDAMDTLTSPSTSERVSAPSFLPDFPSTTGLFGMDDRHTMHRGGLHPSPGMSTTSSGLSHSSSPAVNGLSPPFSVGTSSLASALDDLTAPIHAQSDSSTSSLALVNSISQMDFMSTGSGPSTSAADLDFMFPPSNYEGDGRAVGKEPSPEVPGGPHLMVVGNILKNIAHTAGSASDACSRGESDEANMRIDELRRTIALVAELIAATRLADANSPPLDQSSPDAQALSATTSTHNSPPTVVGVGDVSRHPSPPNHFTPPAAPAPVAMDMQNSLDLSDNSRKRCASSLGGDRVVKALKFTKEEDPPANIPATPVRSTISMSASQILASTPSPPLLSGSAMVDSAVISAFLPSAPASRPVSRPPSPAGLMHSELNLLQQQQSHTLSNYSLHMNLPSSSVLPPVDLNSPPASASSMAATHMMTQFTNAALPWPEPGSSFPHHQHTLSGGLDGIHLQGLSMPGPSTSSHLTGSPPFTSPMQTQMSRPPVPGTSASASASPARPQIVRPTRSLSVSNYVQPFALGVSDTAASDVHDRRQSRPTPLSASQSPGSSPPEQENEVDGDYDSDGEWEYVQSHQGSSGAGFPPRGYGRDAPDPYGTRSSLVYGGRENGSLSNSSTENAATSGGGQGNEMPQEYRADVDRIFFEFLNKICSNLDAMDAKGEPIHQTLMAKKMQRLDESPDFRPFKFRIQAFTNAFLEEVSFPPVGLMVQFHLSNSLRSKDTRRKRFR
ncbi:hypothetical protein JAAARDRAFT_569526 [Jaapia argillacea MUCL 33604]|uniref:Uncharacterized protein n=1 Tax=Jaapia argillacea MUCL 33604 TaxID=933084 RepID=A0A067QEH7_9AGAM|nr:hypothetical protein JAAARDRAFT_569526 [Jaapia argillacea MUCL 33604]